MKNLISIDQFSAHELFNIIVPGCIEMIEVAQKAQSGDYKLPDFRERKLTIFSMEPSTRTMSSYMEASGLLGWSDHRIPPPNQTSLMKDESWAETARTWAIQGAGVIAMRTKIEGVQKFIAEILEKGGWNVSVQNCGDGEHEHPSQCILDLVTIMQEKGRLTDLKVGFLGDLRFGRTVHSLVKALSKSTGISLKLVSVPEMALPKHYLSNFRGEVVSGDDISLLSDCDVVYVTRIQVERFFPEVQHAIQRAKSKYYITREILDGFKPDVIVMHPLPHANGFQPELTNDEVDKRIVMYKQSWYGIPTRMYLLDKGYKNRFKKESPLLSLPSGDMKTILESDLEEYLLKKKGKNEKRDIFKPISNGTVIDHLPSDFGDKIRYVLEKARMFNFDSILHTIEDIPSKSMGKKDVLVLQGVFLPEKMMVSIASFFSNEVTFNVIKDGRFKKMVLDKPGRIENIGECPNQNCITRHDPEAFSIFLRSGGGNVECHYCGRSFEKGEILT